MTRMPAVPQEILIQQTSRQVHPDSLTGARGIAAIWVAVYHYWGGTGGGEISLSIFGQVLQVTPLFSRGYLGVDIFFILSGMVLTFAYSNRIRFDSPDSFITDYRDFLGKRVLRVIPAYYVHFVFLMLAAAPISGQANKIPDVALHLLLSHNLWPTYSTTFSGVYWTLPVEWNFYLVFPLLLLAATIDLKRALIVFAGLFVAVFLLKDYLFTRRGDFYLLNQLPVRIEQFLIGMAFALVFLKKEISPRLAGLLFVVGVAVAAYQVFQPEPDLERNFSGAVRYFMWDRIVLSLAIGSTLYAACIENGWPHRLLTTRWLIFMGLISYSLYLWHAETIHSVIWLARHAPLPLPKLISGVFWTGIAIAACIAVPYLSYRWIESPFLKSRDPRWQPYWRVLGTPRSAIIKAAALILILGIVISKARGFLQ